MDQFEAIQSSHLHIRAEDVLADDLDRHIPLQPRDLRLVHGGHAPSTSCR